MIQSRNESKFCSSSELISPILSNKLKTDSFLSRIQDSLELLELLKNDQLNLKAINNAHSSSNQICMPKNKIHSFPLNNFPQNQDVIKGSFQDNLSDLKNNMLTKYIHKKELKTEFFYESGLKKLKDIQSKTNFEKVQEETELIKELNSINNFKSSLRFSKDLVRNNSQRDSYRDVYQRTKAMLDNKLNELKNKLLMHNQNLYRILSVNSPEKYPKSSRNKDTHFELKIRKNNQKESSPKKSESMKKKKLEKSLDRLILIRNNTSSNLSRKIRPKLKNE